MDKKLYKLILWAYVHDVWKLIRRWWENRKKNIYNVAHAQLTKEFFNNDNFSKFWKDIWNLWSLHHAKDFIDYKFEKKEDKFIAWCIYMGDNLSSWERIDEENKEEKNKENIKHIWLTSIFENIYKEIDWKNLSNKFQYTPDTLNKLNLMPSNKWEEFEEDIVKLFDKTIKANDIKKWFEQLKSEFERNFNEFVLTYKEDEENNIKQIISKLDVICQNYFSLVPSDAYKSIWDISLYDHTKTTVAFAVSLYHIFKKDFEKGNFTYPIPTKDIEDKKVKLITWDFPSIQSYIFDGIKKQTNIAKRLRAKSLRVQLLNEAVIEYLLDKYDLPRANVLLNAGWKFVILANENCNIDQEKQDINKFLINKFNWNIKLSLTSKNYSLKDIRWSWNIKDIFKELFDKLNKEKFKIYDEENLKSIFDYKNVNGKNLCKYCWMNYFSIKENQDENDDWKCENCEKEIKLWEKIVQWKTSINIQYKDENKNFFYDEDFEQKKDITILFNTWELAKDNDILISKSLNLHTPKENWENKSFEDIASKNRKYLCMVKWDVDAMSLLFKWGFGKTYSMSRIMQFSRYLELFFGKYLQEYIEQNYEDVYTVFSWWDDFVFIVPFKDRKKFVKDLYGQFKKFIGFNENIHFSLWISIFKDKTPFRQVDNITEKLLDSSKKTAKEKKGLKSYWVTYYAPNYTKIFETNYDNSHLDPWIYANLSDTARYRLYTVLQECLEYIEDKKMDKFVLNIWRLLYMIWRLDIKEWKKEILEDIKNKFGSIQDIDKTKQYINELLLQLTDNIYENRE